MSSEYVEKTVNKISLQIAWQRKTDDFCHCVNLELLTKYNGKHETIPRPAIPFLGTYSREMKTYAHTKAFT